MLAIRAVVRASTSISSSGALDPLFGTLNNGHLKLAKDTYGSITPGETACIKFRRPPSRFSPAFVDT